MRLCAPWRSISARMLIVTAAVACATAMMTGGALAITVRSWVYQAAQQTVFEAFKNDIDLLGRGASPTSLGYTTTINGVLADPAHYDVAPIPEDGRRAFADKTRREFAEVPESMRHSLDGNPGVYLFARLPDYRVVVGYTVPSRFAPPDTSITVYTVQKLDGVQQRIHQMMTIIAAAVVGSALLGALLGYTATRPLTRLLRKIADAARRVSTGDSSARVPVSPLAELHNLTAGFNTMLDRQSAVIAGLQEQDERARRFVSDVSHELRSPLAALIPTAEVLREELAESTDASGRAAVLMSSQINALAQLVEDLLEMTRLDTGTAQVLDQPIDLVATVEAAIAQRGWNDTIDCQAPTELPITSDPRRITAVVTNLIGNALRHGTPPISVHITHDNTHAIVAVSDHGPGVPPGSEQHIFEPMYKADNARTRSGGAGLGLAIAREHTRLLGGNITYTHTNHTTTFTTTFLKNNPIAGLV